MQQQNKKQKNQQQNHSLQLWGVNLFSVQQQQVSGNYELQFLQDIHIQGRSATLLALIRHKCKLRQHWQQQHQQQLQPVPAALV